MLRRACEGGKGCVEDVVRKSVTGRCGGGECACVCVC